jgi:hypothetical protein
MTTVLVIGVLIWMVGVECRLWVNIHRLNEHLEELHQEMDQVSFKTSGARCSPNQAEGEPLSKLALLRLGS